MNKKGQVAGIIALVVGLVVAVILLVGVLIPVTTSVVGNGTAGPTGQNFTGINWTIASNFTTFILIGVLVLIAGVAIYGMSRK